MPSSYTSTLTTDSSKDSEIISNTVPVVSNAVPIDSEVSEVSEVSEDYDPEATPPPFWVTNRPLFQSCLVDAIKELPASWSLVPIAYEKGFASKKCIRKGWQTVTLSRQEIINLILSGKNCGVGLKTGQPSGLVVAIDVDGTTAQASLASIMGKEVLPATVSFQSGKDGRCQHLFQLPAEYGYLADNTKSVETRPKGGEKNQEQLEFRGSGHYSVLPPSAHPETSGYKWVEGCSPSNLPIALLPQILIDYWVGLLKAPTNKAKTGTTIPTTRSSATHSLPSPENNKAAGQPDKLGAMLENHLSQIERDVLAGKMAESRNCFLNKAAHSLGGLYPDKEEEVRQGLRKIAEQMFSPDEFGEIEPTISSGWRSGILQPIEMTTEYLIKYAGATRDKKNLTVLDLIKHLDEACDSIRLNQMTGSVEVDGEKLDWETLLVQTAKRVGYHLQEASNKQAWKTLAKENQYHPVRDYLKGLPQIRPYIDIWSLASRFLGNDDPLANSLLARSLIFAVARILKPGCKGDICFILLGKQGTGKSTFVKTLASRDWYTDSVTDIGHKDHLGLLHRYWMVELAEFDSITGAKESGALKAFMTKEKDTYRKSHAEETLEHDRTSVIYATSNNYNLLRDETGNRRMGLIEVLCEIDNDLVSELRDDIWVAALDAYLAGAPWWLSAEEKALQAKANKQHLEIDAWEDAIRWSEVARPGYKESFVCNNQNIYHLLGIQPAQQNRLTNARLRAIMVKNGWEYKAVKLKGATVKCWYIDRAYWLQLTPEVAQLEENLTSLSFSRE